MVGFWTSPFGWRTPSKSPVCVRSASPPPAVRYPLLTVPHLVELLPQGREVSMGDLARAFPNLVSPRLPDTCPSINQTVEASRAMNARGLEKLCWSHLDYLDGHFVDIYKSGLMCRVCHFVTCDHCGHRGREVGEVCSQQCPLALSFPTHWSPRGTRPYSTLRLRFMELVELDLTFLCLDKFMWIFD
ncbi:hypothetical protein OBBRIDRAFT_512984 [Obba rivulosa]|uniref:Uncharacterized protein n=1 Tax=Obba rivulosa TaxID=1052685 RepID=A0A8E2AW54_9APHY|nr:hypothetical protein OBBRIDRAFT_512984 [Obba rivulosa]